MFADAIGSLEQLAESEFDDYDVTADQIVAMRQRFTDWWAKLMAHSP